MIGKISLTRSLRLWVVTVTLAVAGLLLGGNNAMAQEKQGGTQTQQGPDWLKELTSRIELHGYAQGGYSWQDANGKQKNDFNLKRTLFWAKARITDRWSFLFMHDFSSVVQEFYTDYRITNDNALTVRLGQFDGEPALAHDAGTG